MSINTMTPVQKIKWMILIAAERMYDLKKDERLLGDVTGEIIDALYSELEEKNPDAEQDARNDIRGGAVETGLPCGWSRHYELKSVAGRTPSGDWVGWTYWYGGGKHGEPEAMDWIDDAYDLQCAEEEKLVTVRTFSKAA